MRKTHVAVRFGLLIALLYGLTMPLYAQTDLPPKTPQSESLMTTMAAGEVGTGNIQIILQWDNADDVDLWVTEPNGTTIYYGLPQSLSGGTLDVDAQRDCQQTPISAENVFWPYNKQPQNGTYTVEVKLYKDCVPTLASWKLWIIVRGQVYSAWEGTALPFSTQFDYESPVNIQHLEMIQVTQDVDGTVPLIANKHALARLYVDCSDPCAQGFIDGVTARMVTSTGLDVTLPPQTVIDEDDWTSKRSDLGMSFNFDLPNMQAGRPELTFHLSVPKGDGSGMEVVTSQSFIVRFNPSLALDVLLVPVQVNGNAPTNTYQTNALNFTRALYPVSVANAHVFSGPVHVWNGDTMIDTDEEQYKLILELEQYLLQDTRSDFVVGIVANNTMLSNGVALDTRRTAIVGQGPRAANTMAHEIAHLYGRKHANTAANLNDLDCYFDALSHEDWPYPDSKIQDAGYVFRSGQWEILDPATHYDIMSYCYTRWISPFTYKALADRIAPGYTLSSTSALAAPGIYYAISGMIHTNDTVEMLPTWHQTFPDQVLPPAGTAYCVEVQNSLNAVLSSHCFDLEFSDPATDQPSTRAPFGLMLPRSASARRIVLKKGAQELVVQTISTATPTVTITSPTASSEWLLNTDQTITWTANDADGGTLRYFVQYTNNNGLTWIPLASNITDTQLTINTEWLPGANTARSRVRVLATDGVNTGSATTALFRSYQHPPVAEILTPEEDVITITQGTPLMLEGVGYDVDDGTITAGNYEWRSSITGRISLGARALARNLPVGQHTITLTVFDAFITPGTDTFIVNVVPPAAPTAAPALLLPANDAVTDSMAQTFTWEAVANATAYQIQIDDNADFSSPERSITVGGTRYAGALFINGEFFWRVRGMNQGAAGPWSSARRYFLSTPIPFESPANAAPLLNYFETNTPELAWSGLTWAVEYHVQVDDNINFQTPEFDQPGIGATSVVVNTLANVDRRYFWRVRGRDAGGTWGSWSAPESFTVDVEA